VLFPLNNAVPPLDAAYQSITAPEDVARSATVPVPQREAAVTVGFAGNGFSLTVCMPVITAGQKAPPGTVWAVYVPTPKEPLNVAGLPPPVKVAPSSGTPAAYNWYMAPVSVLANANATPEPAQ
jgi:hypothetical protein